MVTLLTNILICDFVLNSVKESNEITTRTQCAETFDFKAVVGQFSNKWRLLLNTSNIIIHNYQLLRSDDYYFKFIRKTRILSSLLHLRLRSRNETTMAEIYKNGKLLQTIE